MGKKSKRKSRNRSKTAATATNPVDLKKIARESGIWCPSFDGLPEELQKKALTMSLFLETTAPQSRAKAAASLSNPLTSWKNPRSGEFLTASHLEVITEFMEFSRNSGHEDVPGEITEDYLREYFDIVALCYGCKTVGAFVNVPFKDLGPFYLHPDGSRFTVEEQAMACLDPHPLHSLAEHWVIFRDNIKHIDEFLPGAFPSTTPVIMLMNDGSSAEESWKVDLGAMQSFREHYPNEFSALVEHAPLDAPIVVFAPRLNANEAICAMKELVLHVVAAEEEDRKPAAIAAVADESAAEVAPSSSERNIEDEDIVGTNIMATTSLGNAATTMAHAAEEEVTHHGGQDNASIGNSQACQMCSGTCSRMVALSCGCFFCRKCIIDHGKVQDSCPSCGTHLCLDIHFPNLSRKFFKKHDVCFWCNKKGPRGSMKLCAGCQAAGDKTTYCSIDCHGAAWLTHKKTAHAHLEG